MLWEHRATLLKLMFSLLHVGGFSLFLLLMLLPTLLMMMIMMTMLLLGVALGEKPDLH